MEEIDGSIACYVKMGDDGNWIQADIATIGFSSLDELTPFYDQYLDYSYFTKTNYGFALNKENAAQFMRETLASNPSAGALLEYPNMNIDMFAEYYVSNGVLSGMREDCDISTNISEEGLTFTMSMAVDAMTTCTDYGTTQVERPFTE